MDQIAVLLIDDDEDDYLLARELLQPPGGTPPFKLEWAASYETGLRMLSGRPYDVALVDYRLGARSGLDFLDEDLVMKRSLPIVVWTGAGNSDIDAHAMERGAAAYLEKLHMLGASLPRVLRYAVKGHQVVAALRDQAMSDELTGLRNRRFFEDALRWEARNASRTGGCLSLVLFDIDRFKQLNDTYGHPAGDHVLRAIGVLLRNMFRSQDVSCRYGGEEFALVLRDTPLGVALDRAEQLRKAVGNLHLTHEGKRLPAISLSLGVTFAEGAVVSAPELLACADQALYAAKRGGRDQVVSTLWSASSPPINQVSGP